MNKNNKLFQELNIDPELVVNFFLFFSRFEYALKRISRYANGNEKKVIANWELFASDYNDVFQQNINPELNEAINYLLENPPQKQILIDGRLDWKPLTFGSNQQLTKVIHCIKTIRNNLFHGGKFPSGPQDEPARNPTLLKYALLILAEILDLSESLKEEFEDSFTNSKRIYKAAV